MYTFEGINSLTYRQANRPFDHDAFEHLCLSLFQRRTDMFGMITGYFDDSGTSANDSVVVVAGYIASVAQWQRFNREWSALLSRYGVMAMHRADLESFQGEFADWTPEKRTEFVEKAQQIIKRRTQSAIGKAVIKADFEELFPDNLKEFYGGAYGFCATLCFARTKRLLDKEKFKEPIDWVFESGTRGSGQIARLFNELHGNPQTRKDFRLGTFTLAGKDVLPLQAADVIAYEAFKHVTNQIIVQPRRKIRLSLEHLVRPQDEENLELWTRERLEEYLKSRVAEELIKPRV